MVRQVKKKTNPGDYVNKKKNWGNILKTIKIGIAV